MGLQGEKYIKKLRSDNGGSTIVIVLVAVAFVSILVTVLLFLSLENIQMKRVDREGKENFYNAESAMSEVRAGVQKTASDAISKAYSDVLVNYNAVSQDESTARFHSLFQNYLLGDASGLFTYDGLSGSYKYSADKIKSYISDAAYTDVSGSKLGVDVGSSGVTLKGVSIKYTRQGYISTIQTDIKINLPDFTYTGSAAAMSAVPDYAIVADTGITQSAGGTATIRGNAYAGNITLSGAGNSLVVDGSDYFISNGTISLDGGASLTVNANSSLWSQNINIGNESSAALSGDTYLTNDLSLSGNGSAATLSGRFYGFGSSLNDPDSSSSIVVNGKGTSIDMSGLTSLLLAGRSFITNISDSVNNVMTGESIAVKSDQLAYLIPDDCLTGGQGNPMLVTTAGMPPNYDALYKSYVNYGKAVIGSKPLSNYISNVQLVYYPISGTGQTLVYYYMKFADTAGANRYFTDFFSSNPSRIKAYLSAYSSGISAPQGSSAIAGDGYTYVNGEVNMINASAVNTTTTDKLTSMFDSLCSTLSATSDVSGISSVYDYIVNTGALSSITGEQKIFYENGIPKAIVSGEDYTIDGNTPDSVNFIVASGDVNVNKDFTGLIIAGGTVYLNNGSSVISSRTNVSDALLAEAGDGTYVTAFLNNLGSSSSGGNLPQPGGTDNWDMSRLVVYQNWSKT